MIINKLSTDGVKNSIVSIENETQKRSTNTWYYGKIHRRAHSAASKKVYYPTSDWAQLAAVNEREK